MNKDQHSSDYFKKLADIRLSDSSRARMEEELRAYARFHGVRIGEDGRSREQVPQRTSWFIPFNFKKPMAPIVVALVLMVGAGGTVAAAESARPGDALFPVERAVEKARVALAFDSETKAELRARFADERIEEFRSLVTDAEASVAAESDAAATTSVATDERARVEAAVDVLVDYAASAGLDSETRADFVGRLNSEIEKLDLRLENGTRLRLDGGEVRLDSSDDVRVDGDTSVSSDGQLDLGGVFGTNGRTDNVPPFSGSLEIEADIFTDATLVKVEYNGRSETFRTDADTRAEIIAAVAAKYSLDRSTVDAALSIETEGRATRPNDVDSDADVRIDTDIDASVGGGVSGNSGSGSAGIEAGAGGSVELDLR